MNVSLTNELQSYVNDKVATGLYHSASEVVREALRLHQEHGQLRELQKQELREQVQIGLDQLDRGEGIPGDQVFKELRNKGKNRNKRGNKKP